MPNRNDERMILVTGAPGVGKTTVARLLAQRRPRSAHIEADHLHRMIITGGQWPSAGTTEANRQLLLRTRNAAILARSFHSAGILPIIDEVIGTEAQVAILDEELSIDSLAIVALTASSIVIAARDATRSKHTAANYPGIEHEIHRVIGTLACRIDTTHLTIDATVDAIEAAVG